MMNATVATVVVVARTEWMGPKEKKQTYRTLNTRNTHNLEDYPYRLSCNIYCNISGKAPLSTQSKDARESTLVERKFAITIPENDIQCIQWLINTHEAISASC